MRSDIGVDIVLQSDGDEGPGCRFGRLPVVFGLDAAGAADRVLGLGQVDGRKVKD